MKTKTEKNTNSLLTRRNILKATLQSAFAGSITANIFVAGCRKSLRRSQLPYIFLITVDTLRRDYLGCYGQTLDLSPNTDNFAADATVYELCYSHAPETLYSFSSIHTGFYPHETQIMMRALPPGVDTIAEALQKSDYNTVAVVSNYVLTKPRGFEQGFLVYDDTMQQKESFRPYPERVAQSTTDRAIELLTQYRYTPLFMWIHYQDPHGPYTPPPPYNSMFYDKSRPPRPIQPNPQLSGFGGIPIYQKLDDSTDYNYYLSQYQGEIRYQDEHFGRFIASLKKLDLYDKSVIIFSSDHGECLGENNYYFCHTENVYQPLIQVPLIIKYPDKNPERRTDIVQHIDLMPTIRTLAGLRPQRILRGHNLLLPCPNQREIFAEMNNNKIKEWHKLSLIFNNMKLIYTPILGKWELYNLASDPVEQDNLADRPEYIDQASNMKKRLQRLAKEDLLKTQPADGREVTQREIENLKSLGYLE